MLRSDDASEPRDGICGVCGQPMPLGEEMSRYHAYHAFYCANIIPNSAAFERVTMLRSAAARELERVEYLMDRGAVFVFGSNEEGKHGGGAARLAYMKYGALWFKGEGRAGRSYAIPTKRTWREALPLPKIERYVNDFLYHARVQAPDDIFAVTRIGCGLAGYRDADISPFFRDAPSNCDLPEGWRR